MKSIVLSMLMITVVAGCRGRQPEGASGLLDVDKQVTITCTGDDGSAWGVTLAGWNYGVGEGLPAGLKLSHVGNPVLETSAVVHYEPEAKLVVIYKEGGFQTEFTDQKYVGVLEVSDEALTPVSCQL